MILMKKWHLFFICGLTWAGKWTLINWLLNQNINSLEFAMSCKTREPRPGEIIWKDYIKLSKEEFQKQIKENKFLEYNFVHNQDYYGTRKIDVIDNGILKWKNILKEIDMLIIPTILKDLDYMRENFSIVCLDLPVELVKDRMQKRWDDVDWLDYKNRIKSASEEKKYSHLCDFVVDASASPEEVLVKVKDFINSKI